MKPSSRLFGSGGQELTRTDQTGGCMRNIPRISTLVTILVCGPIGVAAAQSSDERSRNDDSATETAVASQPADDTLTAAADTAQKKGGGLLGKVKGVARNKVVQQIAKTAACTMLPGGQVVAGAIDAAANKDAVGAAAGAATGTTCMPGMGGAGAMASGAMAGGAMPGGAGMSAAAAAAAGAGGQPSGMDPAMMAAYSAQMAAAMQAMQAQMAQPGAAGAGMPPGATGMPPGAMGAPGEAGGKALQVSSDLPGDLKKGKTVIRNIDWIPGGGAVSPAGADGFGQAMAQVAAAMKQAGGSYRLDLYMDKHSGDVVVRALGPERLAAVQASLVQGGVAPGPDGPQIGKSKKDGDPRLEIVRR